MDFTMVFNRVISAEGGFTNNPDDNGNWTSNKAGTGLLKGTKYGIAANTYPDLDIENLTRDQAKIIYHRDWWVKLGMTRFSNAMQYQMFDSAFNHGMRNASKIFQRAVGAVDDGIIGPNTLKAASKISEDDLLLRFLANRLKFYTSLSTFKIFGAGWTNRVAENLLFAAEDNKN
jgi:lysozyme family protein